MAVALKVIIALACFAACGVSADADELELDVDAIKAAIAEADYVCHEIDLITGPTYVPEGTELNVRCGTGYNYIVTIRPSGRYDVRVQRRF